MSVAFDGRSPLSEITWTVRYHERWVVLGPNGSGKTTLLRVVALYQAPTKGSVQVLGHIRGRCDVREVRKHIGFLSAALEEHFPEHVPAREIVLTGKNAALAPWWHSYDSIDYARAEALLQKVGCAHIRDEVFGALSSGEKQRVQLARVLMSDPSLLLLDEPAAGLDLRGREELVRSLSAIASSLAARPCVLVTHHVEEIPPNVTHALVLSNGRIVAQGQVSDVLTSAILEAAFHCPLEVERRSGRFFCWSRDEY